MSSNRSVVFIILAVILGLAAGIAYTYFFQSFRIIKSPLIKNETALKEYLGLSPFFPKPLRYKTESGQLVNINSLSFVRLSKWKKTNDCIGPGGSGTLLFCFEEIRKKTHVSINIYSNQNGIAQADPKRVDELLNFNLLTILENRFSISQDKRKLILGRSGSEGGVFGW